MGGEKNDNWDLILAFRDTYSNGFKVVSMKRGILWIELADWNTFDVR
jgi:hypothetical protein